MEPKQPITLCYSPASPSRSQHCSQGGTRAGATRRSRHGFRGLPMTQWVYGFGGGSADGDASMKNLLGGKGANLAEMCVAGPAGAARASPSPPRPASTITPTARPIPPTWTTRSPPALATGRADRPARRFGDAANPLLVSVRSGARASMPGMMDTVLNLGLNDETVEGLAKLCPATAASPSTAIAASSRCTPTWCWTWTTTMFEEILDDHKDRLGRHRRHRPDGRGLGSGGRRLQGRGRARAGPALPAGPATTSCGARSAPCSPAG